MPARIHRQLSAESPIAFREPPRFSGEPRFCGDTALSRLYLNGCKKGPELSVEKLLDAAALSQQVLHQHLSRLPARMPPLPSAATPRQLTAAFTPPISLPRAAQRDSRPPPTPTSPWSPGANTARGLPKPAAPSAASARGEEPSRAPALTAQLRRRAGTGPGPSGRRERAAEARQGAGGVRAETPGARRLPQAARGRPLPGLSPRRWRTEGRERRRAQGGGVTAATAGCGS